MAGIRDALRKARLLEQGNVTTADGTHAHKVKHDTTSYQLLNLRTKEDAHEVQQPYINQYGELIVPFNSHPKYHYWNGGMSIDEILQELGASEEVVAKYVE